MASKFTKAHSEQAFFKVGLYGKTGSGKTLTSLLWAEWLAAREKKRVAVIDTEHGTDFYAMDIPERKVHPAAFDFDRVVTRSITESVEALESINPNEYGVVVLDSITHLWEATRNCYNGPLTSKGGIPIHAWGTLKKPYKRLMSLFLDGNWHGIICGREGVILTEDDGELTVTGTKMKAEGETPYEPHILGRMIGAPVKSDGQTKYIISVFFEKDRSGILTGREFEWPTYEIIEPVVNHLSGGAQGKLGMPDDATEIDIAAQERATEQEEAERQTLFAQIKTAIVGAASVTALRSAWDLIKGKKGRLGEENYELLATIKEARKTELMQAQGV